MKDAIGQFNSWQCPTCRKFIPKPKEGDTSKCKNCGEELYFSVMELPELETAKKELEEVLADDPYQRIFNLKEPIEAGQTIGLNLEEVLRLYGSGENFAFVTFTNRSGLFKWISKFAEKNGISFSEAVVVFASAGVKAYFEKKKKAAKERH
jgi:hypothetical protein